MTAWKDQPPLTRRQIRMSERGQRTNVEPDRPEQDPAETDRRAPDSWQGGPAPFEAVRPRVPSYDGPSFRNGPVSVDSSDPPAAEASATARPREAPQPTQADHRASHRRERDPQLRPTSVPPEPLLIPIPQAVSGVAGNEDQHTESAPVHSVAQAAQVDEHMPTRRELRVLRAKSSAVQDFANTQSQQPAPAESVAPPLAASTAQSLSPDFTQIIEAPPIDVAPEIVSPPPVAPDPVGSHEVDPANSHEVDAIPQVYTPPFGHWSTQAGIDDQNQVIEHAVRRDLSTSSGAITTSALVLPSIPQAGDITRPVSNTGEILITGTVDLPLILGSTGSYPPHYDRSDIDALIEADDREDSAADSAPVRAVRAVSTHAATPGMVVGRMPRQGRIPLVLAVVAAVMAIGVVVLVVAGFIFKVF